MFLKKPQDARKKVQIQPNQKCYFSSDLSSWDEDDSNSFTLSEDEFSHPPSPTPSASSILSSASISSVKDPFLPHSPRPSLFTGHSLPPKSLPADQFSFSSEDEFSPPPTRPRHSTASSNSSIKDHCFPPSAPPITEHSIPPPLADPSILPPITGPSIPPPLTDPSIPPPLADPSNPPAITDPSNPPSRPTLFSGPLLFIASHPWNFLPVNFCGFSSEDENSPPSSPARPSTASPPAAASNSPISDPSLPQPISEPSFPHRSSTSTSVSAPLLFTPPSSPLNSTEDLNNNSYSKSPAVLPAILINQSVFLRNLNLCRPRSLKRLNQKFTPNKRITRLKMKKIMKV